jgi:hypothetical protein
MTAKKKPVLRYTPAWMKKKEIEKAAKEPQHARSVRAAAKRMANVEAAIGSRAANKLWLEETAEAKKTWDWKAREKADRKYSSKYEAHKEMSKAKGGYVKKYAKGGKVRKARR